MLRCLLVDDERPARERMRRLLGAIEDVSIVGEASDGLAALEQVATLDPDLVLLDIDLPELDGLGVAAALPARAPAIIFVTAYHEHALKAFELAALDYLVKPIVAERLREAIARVRSRRSPSPAEAVARAASLLQPKGPSRMAIKCGAKFVVIDPAQVSAILATDHYASILADGKELLSEQALDELERRLDPQRFVRVHRSAIINLDYLRELVNEGDRRYFAQLGDKAATRVPISRERLPAVKALLGID